MKTLLINLPKTFQEVKEASPLPDLVQGFIKKIALPPIGITYVASSAEAAGHKADILDADLLDYGLRDIIEGIENGAYDIIGLSCYSSYWRTATNIIKGLKDKFPSLPIVVGGPHTRYYPRQTLEYSLADYVIAGEGELSFAKLLDVLEKEGDLSVVPGLLYRKNGQIIVNEQGEYIQNLDQLPFPAWDKLPLDQYRVSIKDRKNCSLILVHRGCPYNCSFCSKESRFGRVVRKRSPQNIVDEIEYVNRKFNVRYLSFCEDTLTVDKELVKEMCREIIKRKIDIWWDCRSRADGTDEELISLMSQAGCKLIKVGVEAADEYIRNKILRKGITDEQIRFTINTCRKYGIETYGFFMLGCPEETRGTMEKTVRYAIELNPDYVQFTLFQLFNPYCDSYKWAEARGYIEKDYVDKFFRGKAEFWKLLETEDLSIPERKGIAYQAHRRFFLRPSYIWMRLKTIRSWHALWLHITAGLSILLQKKPS